LFVRQANFRADQQVSVLIFDLTLNDMTSGLRIDHYRTNDYYCDKIKKSADGDSFDGRAR
jgi:hypothetical protein